MKATFDLSLRRAIMSRKSIGRFAILFIGALMIAFGLLPAQLSAQELTLTSGATTTVAAGDAACLTDLTIRNDVTDFGKKDHGCTGTRLFTNLATGIAAIPFDMPKVDLTATARFVKQFHVQAVQGAATTSFVPILIAVPVSWRGLLFNDNAVPGLGPLDSVGAHIDVNMFLRITQGTARATVTENRFLGATHAGIAGCLSIPSATAVSGANLAAKCLLAIVQDNEGSGTVFLSGIVETGKTYNIELELRSDLFSFDAGVERVGAFGGHPQGNFANNVFNNEPFGLIWTSPMSITVGTDFQSNIQALQNEITQLRADLDNLRQEFKTHTHVYLTGKGVGQNNTRANTSTP